VPPGEALIILADTRQASQRPSGYQPLCPGDKVVFTGDMDMDRADIEAPATAAGLRVTTSVSSKTALVVAADPHTQSGKAQTARKLGIRPVTKQVFLHQLNQLQPTTSGFNS
jgi:DNA polymerase-3 subunit epsilon